MKNKFIKYIFYLVIIICILSTVLFVRNINLVKSEDFYIFMKKAYTTKDGYTEEISEHMSEKVFNNINAFKIFSGSSKYKKPYKITLFELKEDYKRIGLNKLYIYMQDSMSVSDDNNKEIGGYREGLTKYIVQKVNNTWYITDNSISV